VGPLARTLVPVGHLRPFSRAPGLARHRPTSVSP
jgi:hypothetical protein